MTQQPHDPETLRDAYVATLYEVDLEGQRVVLRVGHRVAAALQRALRSRGAASAAFVTAWNPGSTVLNVSENRQRQRALCEALAEAGFDWLEGRGVDPGGRWLAEHSVLIAGIERERANALAETFGQNAWLWVAIDEPVRLVFTAHWHRRAGA